MHHPVLAVVAVHLAAVDPDGLVVLDLDGEGGRRRHVGRGGGHKPRKDGVIDGLARLFEARLRHRVVLFFIFFLSVNRDGGLIGWTRETAYRCKVIVGDRVARVGRDLLGVEPELAILADRHVEVGGRGERGEEGQGAQSAGEEPHG